MFEHCRRKLIVQPRVQFGLVALIAGSGVWGSLITHLFYRLQFPPANSPDILAAGTALRIAIAVAVGTFFPLIYFAMVFSNRLSGPIYRLIKHMRAVAGGQPPGKLTSRSKDCHPELADAYNDLLSRIDIGARAGSSKTDQ